MRDKRVVIVGGGASGVILAAHLLRLPGRDLRVTLIERAGTIGRGVAYGTPEPSHILNTRAASMSAFADDADHFWRWLLRSGASADTRCSDPFCFVPRRVYADYLGDLTRSWRAGAGDGRLDVVTGDCVGIREVQGGIAAELADRTVHVGDVAVLATGHDLPEPAADSPYVSPWMVPREAGIAPADRVFVIGTGLSMVDAVVGLANSGHRGRITALSRHGKLPLAHQRTTPMRIDAADVPFGTDISYLLRWFRRTAGWVAERGGDWRDVMDGVRPHVAEIWQSLSPAARRRFLRHARTFWEIHRHRMPPESELRLHGAMATSHLDLVAGRFLGIEPDGAGVRVHFRRRGAAAPESLVVAKVVDCKGILRDPAEAGAGLVRTLIDKGAARPDPLRIGLDVDGACAVVDRDGRASPRLFAIGPVTRARFWEVTAIPDIRVQCAHLAQRLAETLTRDGAAAPGGLTSLSIY
ncbi:hypothetical protein GCM10011390_16210 [Aureimonas endophytica]|uniref:FAD-dependent urate hydroxylase HpyO/Asp monooxygenase CreE-like FAD/NAD(P)-binding domain-containing protein n=1 Tax=Aureimonas endophytica TaxID=2027858 RepID=A0A916ZH73_9HYPH|nr:FAD/NAD(P)-binding protein [Aureimonas endophytica]GGD98200.1 hypothetical protein GCM10011390_16210 [Aureimonas endophytica]